MCKTLFFLCGISLLIFPVGAEAQQGTWVDIRTDYYVDERESVHEAKQKLLHYAREQALAKVVGIQISGATLSSETETQESYFSSFQQLISTSHSGKIMDEESPRYHLELEGQALRLWITYRGKVAEETDRPDPGFQLQLSSDRSVYQLGDPIRFTVTSSMDAYITVVSILPDNRAAIIFPNRFMRENRILAHQPRRIPSVEEERMVAFTASESEDMKAPYSEIVMVIATKTPVQFGQLLSDTEYTDAWLSINRMLLNIPRNMRTEQMVQVTVVR